MSKELKFRDIHDWIQENKDRVAVAFIPEDRCEPMRLILDALNAGKAGMKEIEREQLRLAKEEFPETIRVVAWAGVDGPAGIILYCEVLPPTPQQQPPRRDILGFYKP